MVDKEERDIKSIQDDEKLAIKAIFGDDAKFIEQIWKVWKPLDVIIHLEPLAEPSENVQNEPRRKVSVDLKVTCSAEYPNRPPHLDLQNVQGISQESCKQLLEKLNIKMKDLIGNEMIMELCGDIREFLSNQDSRPVGSFHDNMMKTKANEVVEINRKRLDSERRELELVEEEQERIAGERQLKKETELGKQLAKNQLEGECRMIGGRRIVILSNIPIKRKRIHPFCNEWMGFANNEQLLISEWTFRYSIGKIPNESKKRDFGPFLKRLEGVVEELKPLCELNPTDPNLVEYAFIHVQKSVVSLSNFSVQVFVAQKVYPEEENLLEVYQMVATNSSLLRRLAAQAVCGLRYLHEQQLSHSALTIGSVWLRENVFRFSDFATLAVLTDLANHFIEFILEKKPRDHVNVEEHDKPKRKDLFQLGTLLDELMITARSSNYSRVPTPDVPNKDPSGSSLSKFIAKCQEAKNIDQLVDDSFLNHELPLSGCDDLFTSFGGAMDQQSRVMKEFVVIRMLGKGGFGDVLLARNKLDSMDYAVKRIPLNAGNERLNRRIKKEAKLFAKLNHPNVVRYFSAWQEDLNPIASSELATSDESLGAVPIPGKKRLNAGRNRVELKEVLLSDNEGFEGNSLLPPQLRAIEREAAAAAAVAKSKKCAAETSEWSTSYNLKEKKSESSDSSADSSESDSEANNQKGKHSKKSNVSSSLLHSNGRVQTLFSPQGGGGGLSLGDNEFDTFWEEESEKDEDDDDDEDDEEDTENQYTSEVDDSVDIVFKDESDEQQKIKKKHLEDVTQSEEEIAVPVIATPTIQRPRVLIIQMEYCEKGTLRQCIDDGLFVNDSDLVWRIFSEILCGLQYIHNQGMIHRDIKPMNIFLNAQQNVKIGDFGLATRELLKTKKSTEKSGSLEAVLENGSISKTLEQTRDIGTQLYMAPELFNKEMTKSKKPYSSKIDVYSTGVVLFEMFYRPLPPGMERISTLNALRNEASIPQDFGTNFSGFQTSAARKTIELMLKQNPDERPTVDDLLNDENLPMNKGEDVQFQKQFSRIIKKRGSCMHNWLLEKQFQEEIPAASNYCYDVEICKERFNNNRVFMVEKLRAEFSIILKAHAYEMIHTHTLVPASTARASAPVRLKPAELLDHFGLPLALPIDLRQNFVRYCVRNSVNRLKRYSFGRVYCVDDSKCNTHPQERWECCVDSIGPQTVSTSLEAELLLTAWQLITNSLKGLKIILRIGHVQLIEAVLRHLKISDEFRGVVLNCLHCFSTSDKVLSNSEKTEQLGGVIGLKTATSLLSNLPCQNSLERFRESCRLLLKSRDENVRNVTEAVLSELEKIAEIFLFGTTEDISRINIVYDAQTSYRPRTFGDGLVFQILVEVPNKRGASKSVAVLAGGRYDSALLRERHPRDFVPTLPRCLTGFGVSMDVMAEIRRRVPNTKGPLPTPCSTLICSLEQPDNELLLSEKFKLAKALWSYNLKADVLHEPVAKLDHLNEHCEKMEISHLLVVCNQIPEIYVRTHHQNSGKMNIEQAIATVCREKTETSTISPPFNLASSSFPQTEISHHDDQHTGTSSTTLTPLSASRSASASFVNPGTANTYRISTANMSNLNVTLAVADRMNAKDRKRIEAQVKTHLSDEIQMFCGRSRIEVIACDVGKELIKTIVGEISRTTSKKEIVVFFDQLAKQNHGKAAKELDALGNQLLTILQQASPIHQNVSLTNSAKLVVILYRVADKFYRVLT